MVKRRGCGCSGIGLLLVVCFALVIFLWNNRWNIAEWLFPREHEQLIEETCELYDIDKWLVMAVIRQESNFDSGAESAAGATGLMQLMPETAEWAIQQGNFNFNLEQALYTPECNIQVGIWYLDWLEEHHYPNDPVCVVAAYNAGASTVDTWIEENRWDGTLEDVQHIPYNETREYVISVFNYYRIYQWLYFE